jgi:hypothetical protein
MDAAVPEVEVADHPHGAGVRRPHHERHAGHALVGAPVGTHELVQPVVLALAEEVQVDLAYRGPEAVGVVEGDDRAVGVRRPQPVVGPVGHVGLEDAVLVHLLHGHGVVAAHDLHLRRAGPVGPNDPLMHTKQLVGVAVAARDQIGDRGLGRGRLRPHAPTARRMAWSGMFAQSGRWSRS